jgi:hypothetical protein
MSQKRPADEALDGSASKSSRTTTSPPTTTAALGGAVGFNALGLASPQFHHKLSFPSTSGGGAPQPSAPARTAGSGGCASSASAAGAPAFPELPGAILEVVKKRNDAELAATTFEKRTTEKQLYRCYFQAWDPESPWDNETNAWIEMMEDTNKVMITAELGIIVCPFIDPEFKTFSLVPLGAAGTADPSIRDYDGCG